MADPPTSPTSIIYHDVSDPRIADLHDWYVKNKKRHFDITLEETRTFVQLFREQQLEEILKREDPKRFQREHGEGTTIELRTSKAFSGKGNDRLVGCLPALHLKSGLMTWRAEEKKRLGEAPSWEDSCETIGLD